MNVAEEKPQIETAPDPVADAIAFMAEAEANPTPDAPPEPAAETKAEDTTPAEGAPTPEPPAPAPTPLPPELAAAAREEKRLRTAREQWEAEKTRREAEIAEREAKIGNVEALLATARQDIVALADKAQMTPDERMKLAQDLWYSAQPPEKRPAEYRKKDPNAELLRSIDERLAKAEAEAREAKEALANREREAAEAKVRGDYLGALEKTVHGAENAPLTQAFLTAEPAAVREDLWMVANQLAKETDADITPVMVVERYEQLLAARYKPLLERLAPATAATKGNTKNAQEGKAPTPTTLSATRTATPTKGRAEPISDEDRVAEATRFLEEAARR